jgi:hypothetical protein
MVIGLCTAPATEPTREDTASPENAFAIGWLAEWTRRGGSFLRQGEEWFSGWPEYDLAPGYRTEEQILSANPWMQDLKADQRTRILLERGAEQNATYHRGMRALLDVLHAVSGGSESVKQICTADPTLGLPPQTASIGEA